MLFNTYSYIFLFLPVSCLLFVGVVKWRPQWLYVSTTLISVVFILASGPRSMLVLGFSILVNYFLLRLLRPGGQTVLTIGILFNVGYLAYFKYAAFVLSNLAVFFPKTPLLKIALPIGISFYTFQKITVLVDRYKGRVSIGSVWDYALFVTFFPQLIAGPIIHYNELIAQFHRPAREILENIKQTIDRGLCLFTLGLAKKVVLADFFSSYADPIFAGSHPLDTCAAWKASVSYSLQIYFDFSGYVDMAVGSALFFGIVLPINFNSPYKAGSFIDFWRRWHITLSNFLRDYLYIPMGGGRSGIIAQLRNLLFTMLVGGLWHGAAWGFVLWGFLHGLFLCLNHLANKALPHFQTPRILSVPFMFVAVTLLWVPFRLQHLSATMKFWREMANWDGFRDGVASWFATIDRASVLDPTKWMYDQHGLVWMLVAGVAFAIIWLAPNSNQIVARMDEVLSDVASRNARRTVVRGILFGALLGLALLAMNIHKVAPFIYFQF